MNKIECEERKNHITEINLEKHKKSPLHIDNHITKKSDEFPFSDSCKLYIKKLNEVHELTTTLKTSKPFLKKAIN